MSDCGGNCSSCSGCARELTLTQPEVDFLQLLGQIPFLPVGRLPGDETPIYPQAEPGREDFYARLLTVLEKKGLISLDYALPLSGCVDPDYLRCPLRGSMALTQRGQLVLELLDRQGITL